LPKHTIIVNSLAYSPPYFKTEQTDKNKKDKITLAYTLAETAD
jgi:hypothetical protein